MRVVFAGTPPFAARALAALSEAGHRIALVLTQPDRPAGRGLKLTASAVAQWSTANGLRMEKPATLKTEEALELIRQANADAMVVAAYGLILPRAVLSLPVFGCINIHASLLPRWRGAAPIQRAILAGDEVTGISIMRMDEGLDTGPVLMQERLPIGDRETAGTLTEALSALGARVIVEALGQIPRLHPTPQDPALATYAPKLSKAEAVVDWRRINLEIDRQVRAMDPFPGAETRLQGQPLKIWEARPVEAGGRPGEVLQARNNRWIVACGEGALELLRVQRAGGRRLDVSEFLRGSAVEPGTLLGEKTLASP